MKFELACFIGVLLAATSVLARLPTRDDIYKKLQSHGEKEKCVQHNISEEDKEQWKNRQCPTSDNGKCFLTCVYEYGGMIVDGKYSVSSAKAKSKEWFGESPERLKIAEEATEKCGEKIGDTEGCEVGLKVCQCVNKYMTEVKGLFDE